MVQIYRLKRVVASIKYHHSRVPLFVILSAAKDLFSEFWGLKTPANKGDSFDFHQRD